MKKTKKRLSIYWDNIFLRHIPAYGNFKKVEEEITEHFNFLGIMLKRIILPLITIYLIVALILKINIFGTIFISLLIFIYSNFIPDADFLIKKSKKDSLWYEKLLLLFFAPIIVYHIIKGEAKPIYSKQERSFHNFKSAIIWAIFLFIMGNILWDEEIKILIFTSLGFLGYCFHLTVDGVISLEKSLLKHIRKI